MRRWLALTIVLASCAGADVTARGSVAPATPPSPTPTRTPAPTVSPTPQSAIPATASVGAVVRASGTIHYVAIGASDTVGVGSLDPANGSWPSRVAALLPAGSTYRNLGVSGSLASQAQSEQVPAAVREQPTVVSIWLAVNDINAQVTPQAYSTALSSIVDALVKGTSARIFVGNVPDLRAVPAYAGADPLVVLGYIQSYNGVIAAIAAKATPERVTVVDLFTGSAELTSQITVSTDGFHPSDAGYVLIAQRFATAMRTSGIPLRPGP